jgi:anti-anti-sigma factor
MTANESVLTFSKTAGVLVVTITSSHLRTPETSYAVRDALIEAVTSEGVEDVVLDLNQVTFVGSVGLLGFLALRRLDHVREIVVCNLSSTLKTMFLKCRLINESGSDAPFGYAETVDAALARIKKEAS